LAGGPGSQKIHHDNKPRAVLILFFGIAMTSLQDTFMKYLSGDYPFHELQVIRSAMAVILVAMAGAATGGFAGFDWRSMRPVLARGFILGAGSAFYYVSLAAMTLADATAIYFALPLIVAALSGLMISEKVRAWRWMAALIGFVGVLITIRPGSSLFEPAAILTLIATCLYAIGNLFTRRIGPAVPPLIIALFGGISFMAVALVLALIFGTGRFHSEAHPSLAFLTRAWVMPSLRDWVLLTGFGIATATGFFSYAEAYRKAPASFIAPFEYSAMIWAILFGWWIFGDVPVKTTIAGSAIIIGSGLFLGYWEWRQQRRVRQI
jgi:drug/metabolite transporter (DMT)-like permease